MSELQNTDVKDAAHGSSNAGLLEQKHAIEAKKIHERGPIVGYTSPHDAILAQMRGDPPPEPTDDGYLHEEDLKNFRIKKEREPTPPSQSQPGGGLREMLYDPFDGTPIGLLAFDDIQSSERKRGASGSKRTSTQTRGGDFQDQEEQWPHLSRVLKLQTEISKMHLNMEGIGPGDKGKGAGKGRRGRTVNSMDTRSRQHTFWGEGAGNERHHMQEPTSDTITDEHEGDEEGVDAAGDEENENRKKREAEFASMADHFEERKQAIDEIMSKLDDLSKALTNFHSSQPPNFEFTRSSSRQTTGVTPDATPPHTQTRFPAPYASTNLPNAAPPTLLGSKSISPNPLTPPDPVTNIIPASLSRAQAPQSKAVASLIIDSVDPGKQQLTASPDSIRHHVKLPEAV